MKRTMLSGAMTALHTPTRFTIPAAAKAGILARRSHAFGFDGRFAEALAAGKKVSTIRRLRKIMPKKHDFINLYVGWRTKNCRKVGEGRIVAVANLQEVRDNQPVNRKGEGNAIQKYWTGIARKEGFRKEDDMWKFLHEKHGDHQCFFGGDFFLTEWSLLWK